MAARPHRRHFSDALRARELGTSNFMPSLSPLLGGLRTTAEDEYGFWNVLPNGTPTAIPPFTITFSTTALNGHALLAADEEGVLTVLDTRRSLRAQMHATSPCTAAPARFRAHDNAIFDAIWLEDDTRVATASGDATARVFDLATTCRTALLRGHAASVKAIRPVPASPTVLLTASRDGHVRAFDTRVPSVYDPSVSREVFHKPVFSLEHVHAPPAPAPPARKRRRITADPPLAARVGSVTCLAFMPAADHLLFTAGAADGTVKLWDVRGTDRRRSCAVSKSSFGALSANYVASATPGLEVRDGECGGARRSRSHGIASLDVDASGRYLAVSATDSTIYLYDAADLGLGYAKRLIGHTQTSFYIRSRFSACGSFVVSGSADSKAYIWDVAARGEEGAVAPALQLEGHRGGEAAGVAWCAADGFKVATCGDDATAKVWRVVRGARAAEPGEGEAGLPLNGARRVVVGGSRRRVCRGGRDAEPQAQDGRIAARATKVGVSRRRLRDADIRSFFNSNTSKAAAQV